MSGNISARTGSQTPSSKTTTPSSTPPAPPGETSSPSLKPSPPSECANGLTSVSRYDPWHYMREQAAKLSRGHDLVKAIQYMLKRWPAFTLFLDDGRVCVVDVDGVKPKNFAR